MTRRGSPLVAALALAVLALGVSQSAQPQTVDSPPSEFAWMGKTADKVKGGEYGPDGQLDGQFRLVLRAPVALSTVSLYTVDANGTPVGGQVWDSGVTSNWLLAVEANGQPLNTQHVAQLGTLPAGTVLDLYGSNPGAFDEPGTRFLALLTLADGRQIREFTTIRAAGGVAAAPATADFNGTWLASDNWTYVLTQSGTEVTGRYEGTGPNAGLTGVLRGRVSGNTLTSQYVTSGRNQPSVQGTYVLVREGNVLRGRWAATDGRQGEDYLQPGGGQAAPAPPSTAAQSPQAPPPPAYPPSTAQPPTTTPTLTLEWVDTKADRMSPGAIAPDGRRDGHFRLFTSSPIGSIQSIVLVTTDRRGRPCCGQIWRTDGGGQNMLLGVMSGAYSLNSTYSDYLGTWYPLSRYDLYADDTGYFRHGQKFLAIVTFPDGSRAGAYVTIGGHPPTVGRKPHPGHSKGEGESGDEHEHQGHERHHGAEQRHGG